MHYGIHILLLIYIYIYIYIILYLPSGQGSDVKPSLDQWCCCFHGQLPGVREQFYPVHLSIRTLPFINPCICTQDMIAKSIQYNGMRDF